MKIANFINHYSDSVSNQNLIYFYFKFMRDVEPEAKFRLAYEFPEADDKRHISEVMDELIDDSLHKRIDFRNLLPSILIKFYYF